MGFSKKASSGQKREVPVKYYNHLEEQFNEAIEEEGSNLVCYLAGIIDAGTQPDDEEYTIYDWKDDERQNNLIEKDFGCFVKDGKFHIPNRPTESVIFLVDFPDIMVNYGLLFGSGEDNYLPYRALLAGDWENKASITRLTPKSDTGYSDRSSVSKLAKAMGLVKSGTPSEDFELGELLGGVFMMQVEGQRGIKDDRYFNIKVKEITAKPKKTLAPEYDLEPFGIMLNEENDVELLKFLNPKVVNRLELAEEWEESMLKKQLEEYKASKGGSSDKPKAKPEPKKKASSGPKKIEAQQPEPDGEEDDGIPF